MHVEGPVEDEAYARVPQVSHGGSMHYLVIDELMVMSNSEVLYVYSWSYFRVFQDLVRRIYPKPEQRMRGQWVHRLRVPRTR